MKKARSAWRRPAWWRQPRTEEAFAEEAETAMAPPPAFGNRTDRPSDLLHALSQISPEHREILVLKEVRGLSYAAIARRLGVPEESVAARLYQARQAFLEPWSALDPRASLLKSSPAAPILSHGALHCGRTDLEETDHGVVPEPGPGCVGAAGPGPGYARSP